MGKRIFTLLLLVVVMTTMASAYDFMVDGLYYNYYSVDDESEIYLKADKYTGVAVTAHNSYPTPWEPNYPNISGELQIPDSVSYNGETYSVIAIESNAFNCCYGLTSLQIPNSVISIGEGAFSMTPWYDSQPEGLVYAGMVAYRYKGTMPTSTSIVLKEGCKGIAGKAFEGCTGLTSITIPVTVKSVGKQAFSDCTGLTSVTWNAKDVRSCGSLFGSTSIKTIVFGDDVEYIPGWLCYGLTSLYKVTIGKSVITMGQEVFNGCSGLQTVIWNAKHFNNRNGGYYYDYLFEPFHFTTGISVFRFGDEVEHIPNNLCKGLTCLTAVRISKSVKSIGYNAFSGCTGLTSVVWDAINCNDIYSPFQGLSGIKTFIIENDVERIPGGVCSGMTGLTKVNLIGGSLREVGGGAFSGCTGLTGVYVKGLAPWCRINFNDYSANPLYYAQNLYNNGNKVTKLTIPSSVDSIGSYAFYGYNDLTSLTIGNSVTSIGASAFSNCTGLMGELTIPNSVTEIGYNAFSGCTGLTFLNLGNSLEKLSGFSGCTGLIGELTIPNSVTLIGSSAFSNCTRLTGALAIPNSVTEIGYDAFCNCTGLTSLALGNSVARIGGSAFEGCSGLTGALTIPNSVTEIEYDAFQDCTGLTSLTLGSSVKEIGGEAFSGCTGMTGALNIPNSVTDIGNEAFYNCSGFTSAKIPNSVTYLGSYAFYNCNGLESLTISDSLIRIRDKTFYNCRNLKNIYTGLNPENVELGDEIFNYVPTRTCVLHVKDVYKSLFEMAYQWKDFWNIVGDYSGISDYVPGDVNGDSVVTAADVTALYDIMLNNDSSHVVNGDQNGDGEITAADVTAVYDVLLGSGK